MHRGAQTRWGHAQETVEIPYTPVRTPYGEITSFWPSFFDPSSPELSLIPMKRVQNKKLKMYHSGLTIYYFGWNLHKTKCENLE